MNINLLPWRQKLQRQKICLFYSLWLASFIFTVAVIGWLNFSLHHSIHLEKKKIAFLTKELAVLPIADNAKVKEINKLLAQRDIISPIKLISEALPKQGVLTKLSFDSGTWTLTGLSNGANVVWNFIQKIKKTKLFNSISISHLSQKSYVSFTLRLSRAR
ncbi:PilN domain-containing protein [Coxiella burnetii]|uniref:PilN domain-containing protein n=1 Tax=Coxiella burnetii TaxID=777 RepID=UPI00031FF07B|nr:PilN domain-containing protein [Coxiella burnetii]ATN85150.1 pilus assembly protein PilN [Coxiella burnetii str. Schperling]